MDTHDLLTMTQWLSPAFPLGSFAYSHGLETEIAEGRVTNSGELEDWLRFIVTRGTGATDAILLCQALAGCDVAPHARALHASRERAEEAEAQGAAFAATLRGMGYDQRDAPLPVAVGEAARALSLAPQTVAALYLHAFASNLVSCAVRFVPLGQAQGQSVLAAIKADINRTAKQAAEAELADIRSAAFLADVAAMAHETLQPRVFRT